MKIPKHYRLVDEHPHSYEIHDSRDGRNFHIAKHGLDLKTHGNLSKIDRFAKGGKVKSLDADHIDLDHVTPSGDIIKDEEDESKPFTMSGMSPALDPQSLQMEKIESNSIPSSQEPLVAEPLDIPAQSSPATAVPQAAPTRQLDSPFDPTYLNESLQQEKRTVQAGADAEQAQARKTSEAYDEASDRVEELSDPLKIYQDNKRKNQALFDSFSKHEIDPNHYMKSMSTGNKVLAAIGMILGGAGAGQYGENTAVKIIQNAIDRDIEAQKNNQSNRYNLWKMNLEATHNEMEATLAMQNQLYNVAKVKAIQYAAEAGGPMAQARIAPLIADLDEKIDMNMRRKSLLQASKNDQVMGADPTAYLFMIPEKDRHKAMEEITKMKNIKSLKDGMLQSADHLKSLFMGGTFSPNDRESAVNAYTGRFTKLMEGSFTKEQSEAFVKSFFSGALDADSTVANKEQRLDKVFESAMDDSAFRAGTMGVGLDRFAATRFKKSKSGEKLDQSDQYIQDNQNNPDPQVQKRVNYLKQKLGR